jgi:hypothetical protein
VARRVRQWVDSFLNKRDLAKTLLQGEGRGARRVKTAARAAGNACVPSTQALSPRRPALPAGGRRGRSGGFLELMTTFWAVEILHGLTLFLGHAHRHHRA